MDIHQIFKLLTDLRLLYFDELLSCMSVDKEFRKIVISYPHNVHIHRPMTLNNISSVITTLNHFRNNYISTMIDKSISFYCFQYWCIKKKGLYHSNYITHYILIDKLQSFKILFRDINLSKIYNIVGNLNVIRNIPTDTVILSNNCKIIDKDIGDLPPLREIRMSGCMSVTEDCFTHFYNTNLQILDISFCHQLRDGALSYIAKIKSLRSLNLTFCKGFTDNGLIHLQKTKLEELIMSHCMFTDFGIINLFSVPLKKINVKGTFITIKGLNMLKSMNPGDINVLI